MDKAGLGVKSCISELPSQSKGRYHKITVDHSACFSDVLRTARMNPLTVAVVPRQAGKTNAVLYVIDGSNATVVSPGGRYSRRGKAFMIVMPL